MPVFTDELRVEVCRMTSDDIDLAVVECMRRCEAREQRTCIPEFVLILRDERGWPQDQAEEVGRRALRALRRDSAHSFR